MLTRPFSASVLLLVFSLSAHAAEEATIANADYGAAYKRAAESRKMLLVVFQEKNAAANAFEERILAAPGIADQLQAFEVVRLPVRYSVTIKGQTKTTTLIRHAAFKEMLGRQGVAFVDLTNPESRHYGRVVSVYPFKPGRYMHKAHFAKMLTLPSGSLTQRTLIFAVRIHPEAPASANSQLSAILASESESHSLHQARIGVQGHHNWESRFHRINAKLASNLTSQEVCAESWPGQDLVEAAIECVDSWRHSPGHWSAVRRRHAVFGYDMKRGHNGIWYGTGIFARR